MSSGDVSNLTTTTRIRQAALFFLPLTALNPGFNVTVGDVLLILSILVMLGSISGMPRAAALFSAAAGIVVVISTVVNQAVGAVPGNLVDAAQAWVILTVIIPFGWLLVYDLDDRSIFKPLMLAAVVNAIAVVAQVILPNAYLPTQTRYGMGVFGSRPLGLTGNPNGLGLLMTWAVPMGVYLAATSSRTRSHLGWSFATLFAAAAGILSLSKVSMLGIVVALIVSLFVVRGRKWGLVAGLVGSLIVLTVVFGDAVNWLWGSVSYRLETSASLGQRLAGVVDAWRHVGEWGLFGTGAGGDIVYGEGIAHIHNQIVGFAVQYGVPAGICFLALVILLTIESIRGWNRVDFAVYSLVFLAAQVTLLVHPVYLTRAHYLPMILLLGRLMRDDTDRQNAVAEVG
jgi:O-antigen ligase